MSMDSRRVSKKARGVGLFEILYFSAILTSSFDIFLVVDVGFTFRIAQLLLLLPVAVGLTQSIFSFPDRLKRVTFFLIIWAAVQTVAVCLHGLSGRGAGYSLWMLLNMGVLVATPGLFKGEKAVTRLLSAYVWSFTFMACWGIVQFCAGLFGVGLLVAQWWIDGRLARVNGFSYEPSYYATYLMLGWVLLAKLLEDRKSAESQRIIKHPTLHLGVITFALFLSSSRMALGAMFCWSAYLLAKLLFKRRTIRPSAAIFAIAASPVLALICVPFILPTLARESQEKVILLEGTGLGGSASHSVDDRSSGAAMTAQVFLDHPWLGVGLGGVAEEIAQSSGLDPSNRDDLKLSEGMCVGIEVLAGTGVLGFAAAVAFFLCLLRFQRTLGSFSRVATNVFMRPLVAALFVELILLQLNQNILRQYVWQHIAIMFAVYSGEAGDRPLVANPDPALGRVWHRLAAERFPAMGLEGE